MKVIEKTVWEVIHGRYKKVWKVIECEDEEILGEIVVCGLPRAENYPIGSRRIAMTIIPNKKQKDKQ